MCEPMKDLSYLWDGSQPDWVLVRNEDAITYNRCPFSIYNKKTNMLCLIEDEGVRMEACDKMEEVWRRNS
jgi:hypothetical protein